MTFQENVFVFQGHYKVYYIKKIFIMKVLIKHY